MNPTYSSENLPSDEHIGTTPFGGVNIQLGQISKCICKNLTFVGDKIPCRFIIQQMLQGLNEVVIICIKN